jgi:hypothetical protein
MRVWDKKANKYLPADSYVIAPNIAAGYPFFSVYRMFHGVEGGTEEFTSNVDLEDDLNGDGDYSIVFSFLEIVESVWEAISIAGLRYINRRQMDTRR